MKKEAKIAVSILVCSLLIIVGVFIISNKKEAKQETPEKMNVELEDVNNVSVVDEKLKEGDYRVTQAYLLNYTKKKSSTWYSSKAVISKITKDGNNVNLVLKSKNSNKKITAIVNKDNFNLKKNDSVYFVGTIDISDGTITVAKISKDEIDYSNVVDIEFDDLYDNIYYLKNTYIIVSGYMITHGADYKLYDSKEAYKKDESVGNFFYIYWAEEFNYTGTQTVKLRCFIGDRYSLIGCEMIE